MILIFIKQIVLLDTMTNTSKLQIPVEIKDGRSAYAASLQMILKHVADFHITVVDIISEKYNIPVDEIMNTVTSDSRYTNMLVNPDIHTLSLNSGQEQAQAQEQKQEQKQEQIKYGHQPKPSKTLTGQKKIKIKPKPVYELKSCFDII